ncbi:DoxX family membrane protein [Candidatus Uhrbacteria bacterium]|nr:DoxX family membrane protein [Candidatus Uhrbacteria bacterium]
MKEISSLMIRYTACLLFLWFGIQQLTDPNSWVVFLPEWTGYFPIPSEMLIQLNGWMEVVLALMLVMGLYTKFVALVLGAHLMGIALSVGQATGVRDAALALFTLSLVFSHPDIWTIDRRFQKTVNIS